MKPAYGNGMVSGENRSSFLSRNVRFVWLALVLLTPGTAWLIYDLTPHEEIWHEVIYSLLCVPLFMIFLFTLLAAVISFLLHRMLSKA